MRILLDTHTFLWFIHDDAQLPSTARASIEDDANAIYLSIASPWEIAIKISTGKLQLKWRFEEVFHHNSKLMTSHFCQSVSSI